MKKLLFLMVLLCAPIMAQAAFDWQAFGNPNLQTPQAQGGVQANGQLNYIPLEPLTPGASQGYGSGSFPQYVQSTYQILVTLGAILAVVILVIGGIRYMLSEATHDIERARKQISAAVWGLIILVGSFLILYTLNPDLLKFNLNPQGVAPQALTPNSNVDKWADYRTYQDQLTKNINDPHSSGECSDAIGWLKDNGAYSPNASGANTNQMSQLGCGTPLASRNGNATLCSQLYKEVMTNWTVAFSDGCKNYR